MKRELGAILLAVFLAAPATAQDAETLAAARELSAIMTGDTVTQMANALAAQIWPTIEQRLGPKVDAATLADLRTEFQRSLSTFTSEVMKDAPDIYAHHFNAQELKAIIAFYKSPAGAKTLQEMPKVMADVGTRMAPRMQTLQTDLDSRIRAILEKHGYKN